ncbi:MAG: hypothetical protein R2701_11500 [Acidimicrobiales bacterium]
MAVTMPGQTLQSSMIGMRVSELAPPSPSRLGFGRRLAGFDRRGDGLLELHLLREAVASGDVHAEVAEQLAQHLVGRGVAVLELVDAGRISLSMNWRTAPRTISCSSVHSYIGPPPAIGRSPRTLAQPLDRTVKGAAADDL